ncbi:MAG TPA: hypothetical protein VNA31_11515 [bacterium]|nr:hypothetical protein [bacterium]
MSEAKSWRSVGALIVRCSLFAFVLLAASCNYWGRRRVDQLTPIKPQNPVWIWTPGKVEKWHAVVITQDSVSGIAYRMPVWCESCRLSIPRTRVDSMKLGYHTVAEDLTKGAGIITLAILLEAAVCTLVAPHDPQC